jgi:MYXO-CTERM domain-containing protein
MTNSNKAKVLAAAIIFASAAPAVAQTATDNAIVSDTRDRDDDSGKWGLLGLLGLAGLLGLKRRDRDDDRDTRSTTVTGSRL